MILAESRVNPFIGEEESKIDKVVEEEAKNMNLSTVRLCFKTYLPDEQGHFVKCLTPVYSNQIYDSSKFTSAVSLFAGTNLE